MNLKYISPFQQEPGCIAKLLENSYRELLSENPSLWNPEKDNWAKTDADVFDNPDTIGTCFFLTCLENKVVGFFSFDPRNQPAYGIIGHNCVLPEYRKNGIGKAQIIKILEHLRKRGIQKAKVSTCDHHFFIPAQRMYKSCGFQEIKRTPDKIPFRPNLIHYSKNLY